MARKNKVPAIGIELGTNNSCVAVWQGQNNRAEIMQNEQGFKTTPSFVAFTDEKMLIGDAAKSRAISDPSNTIFDMTNLIGRKYSDPIIKHNLRSWPFKVISGMNDKPVILVKYMNEEKCFFAEEISSMVLKKMREIAQKFLESPVKNAVITVPAYFNYSQRKATKDAGVLAGINVMQIIDEPIAAALAYSFDKSTSCVKNRNIFICDLGGRTFDVSLITLKDDKFEIKAMAETHVGGDDFDQRMVKHYVREFKTKHKKDISGNSRAIRRLRTACERAKWTLSFDKKTTIELDSIYQGIDLYASVTQAMFEQLNIDLFEKCVNTVESCLTDAKIDKSSVDVVVLVGGSSKIPKLHNLLRDFFGNDIIVNNLTEAVACGAAILASLLSGDLKVPKDVHQYLTRLSLAEQVKGDILNDKKFHVIEDNKSNVLIDFQEGVGMTVNVPGSFNISVPHIPRGLPFNVCFGVDSDGMLNVSAEVQTVSKDIIITNENVRVELRNPRGKLS